MEVIFCPYGAIALRMLALWRAVWRLTVALLIQYHSVRDEELLVHYSTFYLMTACCRDCTVLSVLY